MNGVWVLVPEVGEGTRYVRGDQITEVRRVVSTGFSKPDNDRFRVHVTIGDLAGSGNDLHLWSLPDEAAVATAVLRLVKVLGGASTPGLVLLNEDHRVELVPFTEIGDPL